MKTTTKKITEERKEMVDDISDETVNENLEVTEAELDNNKMEALKARMAAKEKMAPAKIVEKKNRAIEFGVVGSGQAGSRLCECWYKLGYNAVAINTATQDLEHIQIPNANKLHLDFGLGGAGKDLNIGFSAAETHHDAINELVNEKLGNAQALLFCTSLGGGSGAGSAEIIVDILSGMNKPVLVLTVLPMNSEDAQTKHNALITLSKFTKLAQSKKIDNLMVIDNARIETIYSDVSSMNFYQVSNEVIVGPIHMFNTLSVEPALTALDPTDLAKVLVDGRGLSVYGVMNVSNYEDETAIAEAIVDNLNDSMLASGFDLKQSRYAGFMLVANEKVWKKIPNVNITYAMSVINETAGTPLGLYRGQYTVDSDENVMKVYSFFSGLGLPESRIEQLKTEAKSRMAKTEAKDEQRNITLKLDAEEETVSAAEAVKKKIQAKKSGLSKLHNNAILDRRKK